jgi:hypothetical protein
MKPSALIAIIAAGAISASAAACPLPDHSKNAGGSSQPVRRLTTASAAGSCTPRAYWLPAQCTSGRSVTSASKTTNHSSPHARKTGSETCTPRTYWLAAHCS